MENLNFIKDVFHKYINQSIEQVINELEQAGENSSNMIQYDGNFYHGSYFVDCYNYDGNKIRIQFYFDCSLLKNISIVKTY